MTVMPDRSPVPDDRLSLSARRHPGAGKAEPLQSARIAWRGDQPVSLSHDDIYFSLADPDDWFAEADHVFIRGNDLPSRFEHLRGCTSRTGFRICELGFGTGLNILALCRYWARYGPLHGHLHLTSIDGYPLAQEDFARAQGLFATRHPTTAPLCEKLIANYPPLMRGQYVIPLTSNITLTLIWEEVMAALEGMNGQIDAFMLDGFIPARNEAMWADRVFEHLARLSHPGSTAATFTVAGHVRRGLAAAGFIPEKRPGFGRKREMLTARRAHKSPQFFVDRAAGRAIDTSETGNGSPHPISGVSGQAINAIAGDPRHNGRPDRRVSADSASTPVKVLIIGAGIAGCTLACHLKRYGARPLLLDTAGHASGASGNPAGLILPRLDMPASPAFHFYRQAYLYTVRFLEQFEDEKLFKRLQGDKKPKDSAERQRHQTLAGAAILPEADLFLTASGDLSFPRAGIVFPKALIAFLARDIDFIQDKIIRYEQTKEGWRLEGASGRYEGDVIVITAGAGTAALAAMLAPSLSLSRGQIDIFHTPDAPETIITQGQYCAPLSPDTILAGATYDDVPANAAVSQSRESTTENKAAAVRLLGFEADLLSPVSARAALRCVPRDYNPISGQLPDPNGKAETDTGPSDTVTDPFGAQNLPKFRNLPKLQEPAVRQYRNTNSRGYNEADAGDSVRAAGCYVLSGLGSRGLVTAPYLADDLARHLIGAPALLSQAERDLVNPARFTEKAAHRRAVPGKHISAQK